MSQLTITLEDNILQAAQEYTRQHGQELNAWVAQLVTEAMQLAAAAPNDQPTQGLSARIQRLYGSLKAPADFDYKKELEDGLAEKYGV